MAKQAVVQEGALTQATKNILNGNFDELYAGNAFVGGSIANDSSMATGKSFSTDADKLLDGGIIVPQHIEITINCLLNTHCVDQAFFTANRAYQVVAVKEVHAVAGDDAGSVNVQVVKDTSTDAPGAGTNLLTNNTNAGFNCKGTANTVQSGTLTGTAASLQLAAGDRLSLDFAGTVATLAGLQVTVSLIRI